MTRQQEDTLTADRLWSEYARTHRPETRAQIIEQFSRLAYSVANRFARRGAENEDLFEAIVASGGLISEFPMAMHPLAENFPRRNRLIAALCAATVVVEARARSGSLITAGHALEYGREVMAVPGPVSSETSAGCHRLIQQGAKLVENGEDVKLRRDEPDRQIRLLLRRETWQSQRRDDIEIVGLDGCRDMLIA